MGVIAQIRKQLREENKRPNRLLTSLGEFKADADLIRAIQELNAIINTGEVFPVGQSPILPI